MNSKLWVDESLKLDQEECIIYPFYVNNGYPRIHIRVGKYDYKKIYANRYVCESVFGLPPDATYEAAHSCGVPRCVNKRHLRWATPSENQMDRVDHGTSNRGEKQGQSKLTKDKVLKILELVNSGKDRKEIADDFGIAYSSIGDIVNGYTWSWLTGIERN